MRTDPAPRPARYRGRFAPSPTGPLHLGSLLAALGSWLVARQAGGDWLVRIEDIDPPREVPGAARRQLETLAAFGLVPDEPVWFQSRRGDRYAAALDRLLAFGDAFPCRCSRSDLAASGGVHHRCVASPSGTGTAYRLRVPPATEVAFADRIRGHYRQALAESVGDFVLRRADGYWAYQLAVVIDDAEQGITDVVRGADLLDSTPRQIHLQRRLRLPTPGYAHLPLLRQGNGEKLSKSLLSTPVDGGDPLPALRLAYQLLGQRPEVLAGTLAGAAKALELALRHFDFTAIPATDQVLAD